MKEKAFELLNKAQEFVAITKFDEAIDLYREVAKIFAAIEQKSFEGFTESEKETFLLLLERLYKNVQICKS